MKFVQIVFPLLLLLGACSSTYEGVTRIDQVPMYGGMDRNSVPELKAADEQLLARTTKGFGNREKASAAFVNHGFQFYGQDDLAMAMKRFNQAWLLNPRNPEVYWGFGSVLHDQGKNCEARKMMEKALSYDYYITGLYPDAARIYTLCSVSDKALSAETKKQYYQKSQKLYEEAVLLDSNTAYVYASWATAFYWKGQYAQAWEKVEKQREFGGEPDAKFLDLLQEKMPDPRN